MNDRLLEEEEGKMRRLRSVVDRAQAILARPDLTMKEACRVVEDTKRTALTLFPDKEDVYDLIYKPRFSRIIAGRFTIPGSLSGRN